MTEKLLGKTILVTGACSGIGLASVREFIGEKAKTIILVSDNKERISKVERDLQGISHTEIFSYAFDVSKEEQWISFVHSLSNKIDKLDVLVNSAGINKRETYKNSEFKNWDKIISVNQTGIFLSMKYCMELLKRSGNASVINLSSITGATGYHAVAYTSSKWAVRGLTKTASLEFGKWGIRVNAILPGFVKTPLNQSNERFITEAVKMSALGRAGEPEEIAKTILFLASDDSSYITGADIIVDGGLMAGGQFKQLAEKFDIY